MFSFLPNSVLQMATIFLSIIIEAFPFVLFGCLVSGFLQIFLSPEWIKKILPKNKILSSLIGAGLGFFFPSCECGIVPIIHQFIQKKVPIHTAFAFMITAPVINPIVIFSTYVAFSNSISFAFLRVLGSFFVAITTASWLAYFYKGNIFKDDSEESIDIPANVDLIGLLADDAEDKEAFLKEAKPKYSLKSRIWVAFQHAIDEFFDTGRYLIFGALMAAAMQTYFPTASLLRNHSYLMISILLMMLLAFVLSLCSEADAFIGSSLLSLFGSSPIIAFLIFGPVVDIKNLLMMNRYFKKTFILKLIGVISVTVIIYALAISLL